MQGSALVLCATRSKVAIRPPAPCIHFAAFGDTQRMLGTARATLDMFAGQTVYAARLHTVCCAAVAKLTVLVPSKRKQLAILQQYESVLVTAGDVAHFHA